MSVIRVMEAAGLKTDVPEFRSGDHVKVHVRVVEGVHRDSVLGTERPGVVRVHI